jgi:hypothetical protein
MQVEFAKGHKNTYGHMYFSCIYKSLFKLVKDVNYIILEKLNIVVYENHILSFKFNIS